MSHETRASTTLWMGSIEHKGNNEPLDAGKEQQKVKHGMKKRTINVFNTDFLKKKRKKKARKFTQGNYFLGNINFMLLLQNLKIPNNLMDSP